MPSRRHISFSVQSGACETIEIGKNVKAERVWMKDCNVNWKSDKAEVANLEYEPPFLSQASMEGSS